MRSWESPGARRWEKQGAGQEPKPRGNAGPRGCALRQPCLPRASCSFDFPFAIKISAWALPPCGALRALRGVQLRRRGASQGAQPAQ